jgi:hypothetical protein
MRDVSLCALVLVVSVGGPIAAQEAARPFADPARHLESADTLVMVGRESGAGGWLAPVSAASIVVAVEDEERGAPSTPSGQPAAQSQAAVDAGTSAALLSALSSGFEPNDRIYVRTTSGEEVVGRFLRASEVSLELEADGQTREILANDVQQVSRRGGSRVKQGTLFGFLTGAAVGIAAMTTSGSESDFSSGDKIFLGTVAGGGVGLFWGAIIGAVLHERAVVYSAEAPTVHVMPVLAPGRASVVLAARF